MRIAWFTHRYHPCIGGAETYGRAMVRRFVASGHAVDVFTSDAEDLWYFTDRKRRRIDQPRIAIVDGATVRRFPVRHLPLQRYFGRLLSYAPHWPTRCRSASYMPIIPGIDRVRGDYDAVVAVGFPYTVFSYAAFRTARAAGAPLILTPFLHLATPDDPYRKHYTRPHQIRLLAEADAVVVVTRLEAEAVADWNIPRSKILLLHMAVEHAEVTGGDPRLIRERLGIAAAAPVIGHLATLDPNKGSTDLIRAVARINAGRPSSRAVQLLMAGTTSPDFERFLAEYPGGAPPGCGCSGCSRTRTASTSTRRSTCSRCLRGPTRSASCSSKRGPTAFPWLPRPRGECRRSSSKGRPGCWCRSPRCKGLRTRSTRS